MNFLSKIFFVVFVCLAAQSFGQFPNGYTPAKVDSLACVAAMHVLDNRYDQLKAGFDSEYKKQYVELYKLLHESRKEELESGYYFVGDSIQAFLQAILKEIQSSNQGLKAQDVQVLVARSSVPNASTYPDGYIIFNLGLLAQMESEDQIAAVFCHELAHHQLKHGSKSIKKHFDALYSKSGQEKIKEIKKSADDAEALEKAEAYLKAVQFNQKRHSRDHESEADSLALVYLKNTRYKPTEMVCMLQLLDVLDSVRYTPCFQLEQVFHFETYGFKKSWLAAEQTMFSDVKSIAQTNWENDSLKTHPDCKHRAAMIARQLDSRVETIPCGSNQNFARLKSVAALECISANFTFKQADLSLFQTLNLLKQWPNNIFLHAMVGENLNTMHLARKNHRFSDYVLPPKRDLPQEFLPFSRFLNNLSHAELGQLAFRYLDRCPAGYLTDEHFLFTKMLAAKNTMRTRELTELKEMYRRQFPKGKYKLEIAEWK
jgi:hypothetical protein